MTTKKIRDIGTNTGGIAQAMASLKHEPNWATPISAFKYILEHYRVAPTIDACASPTNAKCAKFITKEMDVFKQQITEPSWWNPPYNKTDIQKGVKGVDQFVIFAYMQHVIHNQESTILLSSTVTSNPWYTKYFGEEDINIFGEQIECKKLPFRVRFVREGGLRMKSPPFSSIVIVLRPKPMDVIKNIRDKLFQNGGLDKFMEAGYLS